ncbi:50S ribosomal protein L9 [Bienertia sinuspersici]
MDKVTSDLGNSRNSLTTLKAIVHATKRRVEELEAKKYSSKGDGSDSMLEQSTSPYLLSH